MAEKKKTNIKNQALNNSDTKGLPYVERRQRYSALAVVGHFLGILLAARLGEVLP